MPKVIPSHQLNALKIQAGTVDVENANGSIEDVKLYTTLDGRPIMQFSSGKTVEWTWEELLEQAVKEIEEEEI